MLVGEGGEEESKGPSQLTPVHLPRSNRLPGAWGLINHTVCLSVCPCISPVLAAPPRFVASGLHSSCTVPVLPALSAHLSSVLHRMAHTPTRPSVFLFPRFIAFLPALQKPPPPYPQLPYHSPPFGTPKLVHAYMRRIHTPWLHSTPLLIAFFLFHTVISFPRSTDHP